ncbi:MAG: hypothetical protein V3S18_06785 [Dehalococcoidia bacterium]
MPTFYFQREARTATSECYTVMEDAAPVGRLDIHFAPPVIHCTLVVAESVTQEGIQDLVEMVGEDLIDAVGIEQEELIVHVHQGRDLGVYSQNEFGRGNGHPPEGA